MNYIIRRHTKPAYKRCAHFLSGETIGTDCLAAEAALGLKEKSPWIF